MIRWVSATLMVMLATPAWAGDKAAAESLFVAGKQLRAAGNLDEACARFEASVAAEPSIGGWLNLGRCKAELGRTATAWRAYRRAGLMAKAAGQASRAQAARGLAAELEPKLARVAIASPSVAGLELRLDGELVSVRGAIALDPGLHRLTAEAPGRRPWRTELQVVGGETTSVVVPALDERLADEPDVSPRVVAGYAALGTGAVALGVGAALGFSALADRNALDDRGTCSPDFCADESLRRRLRVKSTASTVTLSLGGAAFVGGALALLLAPASETPEESSALRPRSGPGGFGLGLSGRF